MVMLSEIFSPEFWQDPHPMYADLRQDAPVHAVPLRVRTG
jgi:hypothetical protein